MGSSISIPADSVIRCACVLGQYLEIGTTSPRFVKGYGGGFYWAYATIPANVEQSQMCGKVRCGGRELKNVLVVVPAYNEEGSIRSVAESLRRENLDFVVINDGSTDDTAVILDKYSIPHIDLVENLGIGGAVQTGYIYAFTRGYDAAVQFDGDGQHDARFVRELLIPIEDGEADIVVGSRFSGTLSQFRSSAARRLGIRVLSSILYLVSRDSVKDVTSGFRAVNRPVLKLFSESYPTDYPEPESLALAMSRGFVVREVPVVMHERAHGSSSISGLKSIWYMVKVSLSILIVGLFQRKR